MREGMKEKIKLETLLGYLEDDDITFQITGKSWDEIIGYIPSDSPLLEPYYDKRIDELEIIESDVIRISFVKEESC